MTDPASVAGTGGFVGLQVDPGRFQARYLQAGAIDELHYAVSPVVLGQGEAMFAGIDLPALGYRVTEQATTPKAMHVVVAR